MSGLFVRALARAAAAPRAAARAPARQFSAAAVRFNSKQNPNLKGLTDVNEIKSDADLLPTGAQPGTMPTDIEQATGLERLELLGRIQGVDVFDMKPLDSSRKGTMENPITVKSGGPEQYLGCTGSPADSHVVKWLTVSTDRPIERCPECGSVYKINYIGPDLHDDHHHHDAHVTEEEPKTMADFIKPEYRYQ